MGGDGGVVAVKRSYLRSCGKGNSHENKQASETNRAERVRIRCSTCAISNQPLSAPIVACELGNVYNKDALITCLLEKSLNPAFEHIRGLKDVVTCRFTPNPEYQGPSPNKDEATNKFPYMCPITMIELNGKHPFVAVFSTGFVLSEKAIKEVGIAGLQDEYGPFETTDLIKLAPEQDDLNRLRDNMVLRRAKIDEESRARKAAKKKAKSEARILDKKSNGNADNDNKSETVSTKRYRDEKRQEMKHMSNGHKDAGGTEAKGGGGTEKAAAKKQRTATGTSHNRGRQGGVSGGRDGDKMEGSYKVDGVNVVSAAKAAVSQLAQSNPIYSSLFTSSSSGGGSGGGGAKSSKEEARAAANKLFLQVGGSKYTVA